MGRDMVVLRYVIPTGIPCVEGLSTGPPGFRASQFVYIPKDKRSKLDVRVKLKVWL